MYNASLEILKLLKDNGFKAYVVGGYVRDLYLNRKSTDVDICTNATPKELKNIFGTAMLPTVQYGSVTVKYKKIRFEITTFRKDIKYENSRIPIKIKYIDSIVDDLKRRDFTINTLCMDENGEIFDFLNIKEDIDNKVIKMVGSPKKRLKEDSLRILRAVRFATILNFNLDDKLKHYIRKYAYLVKNLSYYRKKEELEKIFVSKNVEYGITLLKELNLVSYLELSNIDDLVITPSLIGIWAQLDVENIYSFPNHDKKVISALKEVIDKDLYDNNVLYKYGLYICSIAAEIKKLPKKIITKKYNDLIIHNIGDLNINGKDIMKILNKKGGTYIKAILSDIEGKVLNKQIKNEYDELKNYIVEKYADVQK